MDFQLGLAGFNIGGRTIHSELHIHPNSAGILTFTPLDDIRLAKMKARFRHVKLIIIDEVSHIFVRK